MKHTPGPWRAELVPTQIGSMYKFTPSRCCMYVDGMSAHNAKDLAWEEAHANARLIAAAPELLEALKQTRAWIDQIGDDSSWKWDQLALIDAAIVKATGGPNEN